MIVSCVSRSSSLSCHSANPLLQMRVTSNLRRCGIAWSYYRARYQGGLLMRGDGEKYSGGCREPVPGFVPGVTRPQSALPYPRRPR
jgi:hypothetical protein